jgi:hypothetical protein
MNNYYVGDIVNSFGSLWTNGFLSSKKIKTVISYNYIIWFCDSKSDTYFNAICTPKITDESEFFKVINE